MSPKKLKNTRNSHKKPQKTAKRTHKKRSASFSGPAFPVPAPPPAFPAPAPPPNVTAPEPLPSSAPPQPDAPSSKDSLPADDNDKEKKDLQDKLKKSRSRIWKLRIIIFLVIVLVIVGFVFSNNNKEGDKQGEGGDKKGEGGDKKGDKKGEGGDNSDDDEGGSTPPKNNFEIILNVISAFSLLVVLAPFGLLYFDRGSSYYIYVIVPALLGILLFFLLGLTVGGLFFQGGWLLGLFVGGVLTVLYYYANAKKTNNKEELADQTLWERIKEKVNVEHDYPAHLNPFEHDHLIQQHEPRIEHII